MTHSPKCLLCFLDDDYQAELRLAAQLLSPRHERALMVYAQRFQATLEGLGSVASCPTHVLKDNEGNENEHFTWWVDEVLTAIKTAPYAEIFTKMTNSYLASIAGNFGKSYTIFSSLMKKLGIAKTKSNRLEKVLYFRGRKGKFGIEDMYHIPFSKRFFISNQRYSVTGQPLLYLGLSILDVASELGADPTMIDDYSFNTYYLKDSSNTRVLDLGNSLFQSLWNSIRPIAGAGSQLKKIGVSNQVPLPGLRTHVDEFVSFTIASVCSFRRRLVTNQDYFAPEYVLPQTLAHWARQQKFDGILYTSTRIDSKKWKIRRDLQISRYRENVAFFTKYNPSTNNDHDTALLKGFEISPPVQASDVRDIGDEVLFDHRKQVANDGKSKDINQIVQRATIDLDVAFEGLVHIDDAGKETPYVATKCGKLQRYLQFLFLMSRLVEKP